MNRKTLLNNSMDQAKNQNAIISELLEDDKEVLSFKIQNLEQELSVAKKAVKARLKDPSVIDASVVEVLYGEVVKLEEKIKLYNNFKKEYYSNED